MADVVRLYGSDDMPAIVGNNITVAFEGEMGQDVGGVTRDFLATYWQHTLDEWFHGELIKVPCVPASRTSEAETAFLAAGRILGHGFILTRTLPVSMIPEWYLEIAFITIEYHSIPLKFSMVHLPVAMIPEWYLEIPFSTTDVLNGKLTGLNDT